MNKRMLPPQGRRIPQQRGTIAPNILPGVKPDDLMEITCKICGSLNFHPVHTLRVASRFHTANGLPTLVQFPLGFACDECNAVNPFDQDALETPSKEKKPDQGFGVVKKEESAGEDLGINVSEDVKSKEKIG